MNRRGFIISAALASTAALSTEAAIAASAAPHVAYTPAAFAAAKAAGEPLLLDFFAPW